MTMDRDAVELKPCPFCGGTNCSLSLRAGAWKFAYCPDCMTEGPAMNNDSDAIAAWNRRAPSAAQLSTETVDKPVDRVGVPEGWKLVPVEMNADMLHAMRAPVVSTEQRYKAMLAVTPPAPAASDGDQV